MTPKKIESLTPEQEALLPIYREQARAIGLSLGPADRALAKSAIDRAYAWIDEPPPEVVYVSGPMAAIDKGIELFPESTRQDVWDQRWCWGQCEMSWIAWYAFAIDHVGVEVEPKLRDGLRIWEDLAKACYMALSWKGTSIVVDHPTETHFDPEERLHSESGPALAFADGTKVFAIHGVRLPPEKGQAILDGALSPEELLAEENSEIRRVMTDRYDTVHGLGAFLRNSDFEVIHEDTDQFGRPRRLLRLEFADDEPIVMVEVVDSTPEPLFTDHGNLWYETFRGEHRAFRKYMLPVHPELFRLPQSVPGQPPPEPLGPAQELTCQNAVASTFGMFGHEYAPDIET